MEAEERRHPEWVIRRIRRNAFSYKWTQRDQSRIALKHARLLSAVLLCALAAASGCEDKPPRLNPKDFVLFGIIDDTSGQRVDNARVRFEPWGETTRTDERGYYELRVPVRKECVWGNVTVSGSGYGSFVWKNLIVRPGGGIQVNVSLPASGEESHEEPFLRGHCETTV